MLPPNQQLVADGKWPVVGESAPRRSDDPWAVTVVGLVRSEREFTFEQLRQWQEHTIEQTVDIHCVTRWSKLNVRFGGIPLKTVLDECVVSTDARFVSFVARSDRNHSTSLPLEDAVSLNALIALTYEGQPLEEIHGGPVRMIVPGRYFYKSVKWLERIEILAEDRLGYWEAQTGYHNNADPFQEQRYAAPNLDRRQVRELFETKDFSGRDLRSIQAANLDLTGLNAACSGLRDADFRNAKLAGACFDGANLSNAHLQGADLRSASFRPADGQIADLEGADFRATDLRGAIFENASLFGATFYGTSADSDQQAARIDHSTRFDEKTLRTLEATPAQLQFISGGEVVD